MGYAERFEVQFTPDAGTQNFTFRGAVGWLRFTGEQQRRIGIHNGYGIGTPVAVLEPYEQRDVMINGATDQLTISWDVDEGFGWDVATFTFLASGDAIESSGGAAAQTLLARSNDKPSLWHTAADPFITWANIAAVMPFYVNRNTGVLTYWQGFAVERDTFSVVVRRTARDYNVPIVFAAAGRSQLVTLFATAVSGLQITLLSVEVALFSSTAAAEIWAELVRITTQPTGGTAVVAQNQHNDGSFIDIRRNGTGGAAEAASPLSSTAWSPGITGAASTVNPVPALQWQTLYSVSGENEALPNAQGGEGFGIFVDANAATTVRMTARLKWIEESI